MSNLDDTMVRLPEAESEPDVSKIHVLVRDSSGAMLLEAVIASMVFAIVGVAVLSGLSTAYDSGSRTEVQSTGENLARNQMESFFAGPYREPQQTPYPNISSVPTNYTVSGTVAFEDTSSPDPEIELITISVDRAGQTIFSLQTLRGREDGLQLRYGSSNDRTNSVRLHDATISGTVYVFLDDPEFIGDNQTQFYLDGSGPLQTEAGFPWDFKGGGVATANPWDTISDPAASNGSHQITARILLTDGNTVNVTANFTISN